MELLTEGVTSRSVRRTVLADDPSLPPPSGPPLIAFLAVVSPTWYCSTPGRRTMTKSTNTNAPQTDYTNCIDKWGAAFRDSVTCDQVRQKLQHATYIDRFNAIISKKPKRGAGNKDFQTDPWSAYAAAGKTGREWDLDGGKVWRLIRFTGCWFLARHTGGFNDFEYWHIGDVSSGSATCLTQRTQPPLRRCLR